MKILRPLMAIAVSAGLASGLDAQSQQGNREIVDMNNLPAVVCKALTAKAADSEILQVEKERGNGKTLYQALVNKDGREWHITVDANGKDVTKPDRAGKNKAKSGKTKEP